MGRCKRAEHCGNPSWCKTAGKCLKAQPSEAPPRHQDGRVKPRIRRNTRWGWECGVGFGWTGHGRTPHEAWANWAQWALWPVSA